MTLSRTTMARLIHLIMKLNGVEIDRILDVVNTTHISLSTHIYGVNAIIRHHCLRFGVYSVEYFQENPSYSFRRADKVIDVIINS